MMDAGWIRVRKLLEKTIVKRAKNIYFNCNDIAR